MNMRRYSRPIVILMVVSTFSLVVHLFVRQNSNKAIIQKRMLEDELVWLKKQLRSARVQNVKMHHVIDDLKPIPDCEVIHIAVICTGHTATRNVVILIKSILFKRKHQLHFHFISDSPARRILEYMFKTWELPSVTMTFHSAEDVQNKTAFKIANMDTENLYKLNMPTILPEDVKKVIIFDSDVLVNMDIAKLWRLLVNLEGTKAIGAFENQNDWYLEALKRDKKDLPVLGKGINTGVLLYDLKALRKMGFVQQAKKIEEKKITLSNFSFGDIFNIILARNSKMIQFLPQTLNLQLRGDSNKDLCNRTVIKIVHGYTHSDVSSGSKCMAVFQKLRNLVLEISGNLLKGESSLCKTTPPSKEQFSFLINKDDDCTDFRIQRINTFRTHLYFVEYEYKPEPNDVTLVTQMTMDRLFVFKELTKHWEGPISVSLHLTEIEAYEFLKFIQEPSLKERKNIGYHIVYKEGTTGLYPYNHLRNVAFQNVNTPYVFLCDADFAPSYGMYQRLRTDTLNNMDSKSKKALVVPAFEQHHHQLEFPKNKKDLLNQLENKTIIPFQINIFSNGHAPTDYTKWVIATAPYKINYGPMYEPYMILPKDAPKYDTRFVGWGWDKLSHTLELVADGYEFLVLPDVFIVHYSHASTYHRTMYFADEKYTRCVETFKGEFLKQMSEKYGQRGDALRHFIYKKNLFSQRNYEQ